MNTEQIQTLFERFFPNGEIDKDHIQSVLQEEFVAFLLVRCDKTVDEVVESFTQRNIAQLLYLGNERQDIMLREAQESTGVDLSKWL